MRLQESTIYPFLEKHPASYEVITVKKNACIVRANEESKYIWYLLEGEVKVVAVSNNGKSIVVDEIAPNNFVGHLSNLFGQNFYCDSFAVTDCTLVRIPIARFLELMQELAFSRLFYLKVNNRLYTMFKKELVKHMFSQQEQLAYYLLQNAKGNECQIKSMYKTSEYLCISRRNLYNMIDSLVTDGCLARTEKGDILIADFEKLQQKALPVATYLNNLI